jgi:TolA-binding protein
MADDAGSPAPAPAPAATMPAIAKTGDPAEDGYMLGYSLWSQKRYADAETELAKVVAKYPKHTRASYAQNLIGRAYLDDGQLAEAAKAFYASYKQFPRGERAPDSLYFLGQTLQKLKKNADACQAYGEFQDVYGAAANATLKAKVAQGRVDAKCGA